MREVSFTITDDKGHAVPSAAVEVYSGTEPVTNATTDANGKSKIALPSAGKYGVTVSKLGFVTSQTTLQVTDEATQEIDITLATAALGKQEIEVSATASVPTTETSTSTTSIAPAEAKQTPGKPATLSEALPLIPGVVRAPDGSVQIAGYGETHSALLVNSVNVTDPATGDFGLSIPIDSVETVSVSEMPYLAEYGRFTAGVVAAETRRGGDKWNYSLNDPLPDFRIRSLHLQGVRDASPRFNIGGPIIPNKLFIVEGAEYLLYKREVFTLPFPQNETRSQAINSFTQMDWLVSPSQTITASLHMAPQTLQYAGLNYFNPQPVTPDASFHQSTATIIDRLSFGGGLLTSTIATTRVSSGVDPQGPADMVLTPGGNMGNYFSQEKRHATRYQWLESWKPRTLHWFGDHALQIGSVVAHSENEGQFHPKSVLIDDASGKLVQQIDFTGVGQYDLADTEPAVYAQDHWTPNAHLGFDMGVRLESQTITHTVRTAPRIGFVWTPAKSSRTVIRGGMGVFYDSVPLDVYAFNSYPQQVVTTYSPDGVIIDGPRKYFNIMEQNPPHHFGFVHRAPVTGNFAPYSIAGNIEVERQVDRFLTVRVKYLQSLAQDVITMQSLQVANHGLLELGSSGTAHTRQIEFTSRIGASEKHQFYFSYVRQYANGDINDASGYLGNFPFPVVRQNVIASLPSEIPNRFLLWGAYSLPDKITIMPKFELRNGFTYQSTDVYQQYVMTTGLQPRFPRYFSADIRVSKDFQLLNKHAIRLSGTVFNLTNHFNALEAHTNIADPLYGVFFGTYSRKFTVDFDFLY